MVLKILHSSQVVVLVSLLEVNAFYIESALGYLKCQWEVYYSSTF